MRYLFFPLVLFLLLSCGKHLHTAGHFKVETETWQMMGQQLHTLQDSLLTIRSVRAGDSLPPESQEYILSPEQTRKVRLALAKIDLDQLEENQVKHDGMDDALEFVFRFRVDGTEKTTHIYLVRNESILQFVDVVNQAIPESLRIAYTERYLQKGY